MLYATLPIDPVQNGISLKLIEMEIDGATSAICKQFRKTKIFLFSTRKRPVIIRNIIVIIINFF